MTEEDIYKMTFRTSHCHYEYIVMSFSLCNALSTFQATVNELMKPFLCHFVVVFFDDILVYSESFEYNLNHLNSVLSTSQEGQFFLKLLKCLFAQRQLEFLGHIVSHQGMAL